eukprot:11191227-Lingulodinium_polyedra.AAC.1
MERARSSEDCIVVFPQWNSPVCEGAPPFPRLPCAQAYAMLNTVFVPQVLQFPFMARTYMCGAVAQFGGAQCGRVEIVDVGKVPGRK